MTVVQSVSEACSKLAAAAEDCFDIVLTEVCGALHIILFPPCGCLDRLTVSCLEWDSLLFQDWMQFTRCLECGGIFFAKGMGLSHSQRVSPIVSDFGRFVSCHVGLVAKVVPSFLMWFPFEAILVYSGKLL